MDRETGNNGSRERSAGQKIARTVARAAVTTLIAGAATLGADQGAKPVEAAGNSPTVTPTQTWTPTATETVTVTVTPTITPTVTPTPYAAGTEIAGLQTTIADRKKRNADDTAIAELKREATALVEPPTVTPSPTGTPDVQATVQAAATKKAVVLGTRQAEIRGTATADAEGTASAAAPVYTPMSEKSGQSNSEGSPIPEKSGQNSGSGSPLGTIGIFAGIGAALSAVYALRTRIPLVRSLGTRIPGPRI